jgi:hypothetical protein
MTFGRRRLPSILFKDRCRPLLVDEFRGLGARERLLEGFEVRTSPRDFRISSIFGSQRTESLRLPGGLVDPLRGVSFGREDELPCQTPGLRHVSVVLIFALVDQTGSILNRLVHILEGSDYFPRRRQNVAEPAGGDMDSRMVPREPVFDEGSGRTFDMISFPAHYIRKGSVADQRAYHRLAGIADRFLLVCCPEGPGNRIHDPVLDRTAHLYNVQIPFNHRVMTSRLGTLIAAARRLSCHCPEMLREYPLHGTSPAHLNPQGYFDVQPRVGLSDVFAEVQDQGGLRRTDRVDAREDNRDRDYYRGDENDRPGAPGNVTILYPGNP